MKKLEKISTILYILSSICSIIYLITRKSGILFCSGALLILASITLICSKKKH